MKRLITLLALFVAACSAPVAGPAPRVSIMTWNVENLFDTRDDPARQDETFLPLAAKRSASHREACGRIRVERWREQCMDWDWSEAVLATKLERVAHVILQVGNGRGPDVLALQEVENIEILDRLRRNYLGAAGYGAPILIEGDDPRGIDVAFLSRLPLKGEPRLHRVPHERRAGDVRGILEATFELPGGALITGYSVHFPAPNHPAASRAEAFRHLFTLARGLPAGRVSFAAGDFNVSAGEEGSHPVTSGGEGGWVVAHREGCGGCRGTHYYAPEREWSFLDMILLSAALDPQRPGSGWRLQPGSVQVANAVPEQSTPRGYPARFELPAASGVSDHWPLTLELERRD